MAFINVNQSTKHRLFLATMILVACLCWWQFCAPGAALAAQQEDGAVVSGSGGGVSAFAGPDLDHRTDLTRSILNVDEEMPTVRSLEELGNVMRYNLEQRVEEVNIRYMANTTDPKPKIEQVYEDIMARDDYLHYSTRGYRFSYKGISGNVVIQFKFLYQSTLEEELAVEDRVPKVLSDIIRPHMNDYAKVKAIHDYIVANVAYNENLEGRSSYAALFEGMAVCQGYALLAHKMLTDAGIINRITKGKAGGGDHVWNLVNLDGHWYHLDCTWDDPLPDRPGRVLYNYYNLTDEQISKDHTWKSGDYPAAANRYDSSWENNAPDLPLYGILDDQRAGSTYAWKVNFNEPVASETVLIYYIYVKDADGRIVKGVRLNMTQNGRSVQVLPPDGGYSVNGGGKYTLFVERGLRSERGMSLKQPVRMGFGVDS